MSPELLVAARRSRLRAGHSSVTAVDAREQLIAEFRRSMVGPGEPDELLVDPPSRTYLCGFLSPVGTEVGDDQNDEFQEGDREASLEGIP